MSSRSRKDLGKKVWAAFKLKTCWYFRVDGKRKEKECNNEIKKRKRQENSLKGKLKVREGNWWKRQATQETSSNNSTGDRYSSKTRRLDNNLCKNPCQINSRYLPRDRVKYL